MFEIGKTYNFVTIDPVTLNGSYTNVKAIANLNFDIAVKFSDVVTIRNKIMQTTGKSLLDPRLATYTMFETQDGEKVVLANDWIDLNSVIEVDAIDMKVYIKNVTTDDLVKIKNILTALGYKIDIETVNVNNSDNDS
jgi:hypothetical protein